MKDRKEKSNIVISIAFVLCLLLLGISATYAFFTRRVETTGERTEGSVISGVLDIDFNTNEYIYNENTQLINDSEKYDKADKTVFSIQRNSTATVDNIAYNLYLDIIELPNELKSKYVKWELYDTNNPDSTIKPIAEGNFDNIGDVKEIQLNQTRIDLPKNENHNYTLYMWLSYSDTELQNDFLQKELQVKVTVKAYTY